MITKWMFFGLQLVVLLLIAILLAACSSLTPENQLANLAAVNGEVKVSDGITELAAIEGPLNPRDVRTLLITEQGNAILEMPDGSFVILDSNSAIEFNRESEHDSEKPFAFNLISGRALVINREYSISPLQVFVGGHIAAQVYHGAMGLKAQTDGDIRERVDCLAGPCLVSGVYMLRSGQNVQTSPDNALNISDGIAYESWISLGKANKSNPEITNLLVSMAPTITQTIVPSITPMEVNRSDQITGTSTLTSSPRATLTERPTITPTTTSTLLPLYYSPTPTATRRVREDIPPPTPFISPTLPPPTLPPSPTIAPISTPIQP